jgi:VPDSG-CTERM motif
MKATLDTRPSSKSRFKGPRLSRYLKASAIAGAAAAPVSVLANFSGAYSVTDPSHPAGVYFDTPGAFGNWTAFLSGPADGTLDTTGAPNQISLDLTQGPHVGTGDYQFLTTAAATGLVSFSYTAQLTNSFSANAAAYFFEGSTLFPLLGSGPFSLIVMAGDSFGFVLITGYTTEAALTISSFSAPEPSAAVPDKGSTLALLAFGFVGLLAFRANVQRAS